jgi:acyl-CoA thioesterase I
MMGVLIRVGGGVSRRSWLANCSALLAAAALAAPAAARAAGPSPLVLVVGDSLSAEYGIARGSGWVALLERRWRDKVAARVLNASISGDTTSGGRSRLPALLAQHKPAVVIIELGGNDALRGLPLAMTRDNLLAMTRAAKAAGARVLIAGMQVPPNYGRRYGDDFARCSRRWRRPKAWRWCPSCWLAWPTGRMPRSCSSPTASTRWPRRTRACWTTSGRCCGRCLPGAALAQEAVAHARPRRHPARPSPAAAAAAVRASACRSGNAPARWHGAPGCRAPWPGRPAASQATSAGHTPVA